MALLLERGTWFYLGNYIWHVTERKFFMAILKVSLDVMLLRERSDMAILMLCKDVIF